MRWVACVYIGMDELKFVDFASTELDGLLRYATALTGDRELARDLVQDALQKVYLRWAVVVAAERPRAYVRTMITREFLSWRRRWSTRNVVLALGDLPAGPAIADHAVRITERDAVWRQLTILPLRQRTVLVLRYYERATDVEIAATLGCSPATVRGYAARALSKLRLSMNPPVVVAKEKS